MCTSRPFLVGYIFLSLGALFQITSIMVVFKPLFDEDYRNEFFPISQLWFIIPIASGAIIFLALLGVLTYWTKGHKTKMGNQVTYQDQQSNRLDSNSAQRTEADQEEVNQGARRKTSRASYRYVPPDSSNATLLPKKHRQDDKEKLNAALKEVLSIQVQPEPWHLLNTDGEFIITLLEAMKKNCDIFASLFDKRELVVDNMFSTAESVPTYNLLIYLKHSNLSAICQSFPWVNLAITTTTVPEIMIKWCNEENWIVPIKVLNWMTSVIDKALNVLKTPISNMGIVDVKKSRNDHGEILNLSTKQGQKAKLCIVPCFNIKNLQGTNEKLSQGVIPSSYYSLREKGRWLAHDPSDKTFKKGGTLQLYKLLQRLVAVKNWGNYIPKYILRNAIWEPDVLKQCDEKTLGIAFIQALKCLHGAIKSKNLPHKQMKWNIMEHLYPKDAPREIERDILEIISNCQTNPVWIHTTLLGNLVKSPYPPLDELKFIMDTIKIYDEERQRNISIITQLIEGVVNVAKKDKVFNSLFSRIEYTGSYYENLRVCTPDEFDIDFVFSFPLGNFELEDHSQPELAVYKKLKVVKFSENYSKKSKFSNCRAKFETFLSENNYLLKNKFINWFNSIIDKVAPELPIEGLGISKINRTKSGPAITWAVRLNSGEKIDVDLVPVFLFSFTAPFPRGVCKEKAPFLSGEDWDWVLVPKPLKNQPSSEILWRAHLLCSEKKLLDRPGGCFKPTIRLVKLLRDTQEWKPLSSYYIKCLAFHLWFGKRDDNSYWREANMPQCVYDMLHKLKVCLQTNSLPSFFFPNFNLLSQLQSQEIAENIHNKLDRILPYLALHPRLYFLPTSSNNL